MYAWGSSERPPDSLMMFFRRVHHRRWHVTTPASPSVRTYYTGYSQWLSIDDAWTFASVEVKR